MVLKIQPGVIVIFNNERYKIKSPLSLEKVLVESLDTGEAISVLLSDLQPHTSQDISTNNRDEAKTCIAFTEQEWKEAKKREKAIQPISLLACPKHEAKRIGGF